MIIKVTEEHINKGRRRNVTCCPVALAVKGATQCTFICVGTFGMGIRMPKKHWWSKQPNSRYDIFTPKNASVFISMFDRGEEVKPFEFELDI